MFRVVVCESKNTAARGFLLQRNKKEIVIYTLKSHSHRDRKLPLPMVERISRMLLHE